MSHSFVCDVLIDDQPETGVWNMALDEALLERALGEDRCHFRLYRWSAPTLSLGYFQEFDRSTIPPALRELSVVRRLSGGGAILHHHELTYSCSIPPTHPFAAHPTELYSMIHAVIQAAFETQSFPVSPRGEALSFADAEPFLCFSRGDERDLVHGRHKILGSAQRRRKGAILQHGSLLLHRSEFAPEFAGVYELLSEKVGFDEVTFENQLIEEIPGRFGKPEIVSLIPPNVSTHAKLLATEKYLHIGKRFQPT